MVLRMITILVLLLVPVMAGADPVVYTPADLDALPFLYGREYFVLRSGRVQMVVQADRMDLGTSFGYLLFDAQDAGQSARKANAFNFDSETGLLSSALSVELGGHAFSAVGDRTVTQWVLRDGIPTVQATWWAGGVRVTEQLRSLASDGVFSRLIRLEGAHLAGEEHVFLNLSLPSGPCSQLGTLLVTPRKGAVLAIAATGDRWPVKFDEARASLRIGPITVAPEQTYELETLLLAQVPSGSEQDLVASVAGAAQAEQAARNAWAAVSRVETADHTISDLFDKARFGLPGMIADDGTINAGIFEYGAQWVRDTSNTVVGTIHAGEFEIAKAALQRILTQMITAEGVTMIGNTFDEPDREQFDQMGELLHALKCYRDWTGDDSLIREHRERLLVAIERPLQPQFRDDTGMVHNKREFWERVLSDAYELAYQTYVIRGLLDAADLAPALGAEDRAERWRKEAALIREAMLSHPSRSLVDRGRLIKRRNITGEIADTSDFPGFQPDTPARPPSGSVASCPMRRRHCRLRSAWSMPVLNSPGVHSKIWTASGTRGGAMAVTTAITRVRNRTSPGHGLSPHALFFAHNTTPDSMM